MQTVSCPGCGAQVEFRSHASVLAVCGYCKATLAKDAGSIKNLGRMADLLEDYSPVQIGTTGTAGERSFTVIGRIQLRYDAGIWNEWYLLCDDGSARWLGDSSGLYTLTAERPVEGGLPAFDALRVLQTYTIGGADYVAAEIRHAQCVGGQGELPFQVGAGWPAPVADLRRSSQFLTLDYSDDGAPKVYTGSAVTLAQLQCQLLRDDDVVAAAAGKFRGKVAALACPSCGSAIDYLPGLTAHLVCPSCHAQVAADGPTAVVLAKADEMARVHSTLELGATATIAGSEYRIIGWMRRRDDEGTEWSEYLLHNARAGFLWLVETDDGWARASVLDDWPEVQGERVVLDKIAFSKLYDYTASVVYVAGAFNWRVAAGDTVRVSEFESGTIKLAREATDAEATWSKSVTVSADQVRAWFGQTVAADKRSPATDKRPRIITYLLWLLGLNLIPLLFSFGSSWLPVLFAAAAIYFPAKFLGSSDKDQS